MWAKSIKWLVMLSAVFAVIGGIAISNSRKQDVEEQVTYQTAPVDRGVVQTGVSAAGILQPLTVVEVKSNVGGRIERLTVDIGDRVQAGQLIALVDPTETEAALLQTQADKDSAEARLQSVESDRQAALARLAQAEVSLELEERQVEADLAQATQGLLAAQARLAQAKANMDVQPRLTETAIEQARASRQAAQDALDEMERATIPQTRQRARAALDEAEANLELSRQEHRRQQELVSRGFVPVAQLESAAARLRSTQAAYDTALQRWETLDEELEAQLRAASERLKQAEAQFEQASENRYLITVRQREHEAAEAAVEQARASLRLVEARQRSVELRQADLEAAQAQLDRTASSRAEVEASLRRIEASLTRAQRDLEFTEIRAPRTGVVVEKFIEEGAVIASGRSGSIAGTDLLILADTSRMFVECSVDETDIAQIRVGQRVLVTVDAYMTERFEGRVARIDPQTRVEQNVTVIPVTVEVLTLIGGRVRPEQMELKPGMNADCEFIVEHRDDALRVPSAAVRSDRAAANGGYHVRVMNGGAPQQREVEIGLRGDSHIEILAGLEEGELVVTREERPLELQQEISSPFGSPVGGRGGRGGRRGG